MLKRFLTWTHKYSLICTHKYSSQAIVSHKHSCVLLCCGKSVHHAGASLVELYTAFAYEGPALVPRIKRELAACLARDGFSSLAQAVGADHRR